MTAHTGPIEIPRRDTASVSCCRLRLTLIAGLFSGLVLLAGCASVTASSVMRPRLTMRSVRLTAATTAKL